MASIVKMPGEEFTESAVIDFAIFGNSEGSPCRFCHSAVLRMLQESGLQLTNLWEILLYVQTRITR